MNFFKSVFSEDPDPPTSGNPTETQTQEPTTLDDHAGSDPNQPDSNPTTPSAGWGLGGLLSTLQVKSDWIETYRRDLEEFGSGLKKETEILREAASKAVKDLPNSIEISASRAQIAEVWKSTAEILSQGNHQSSLADDSDSSDSNLNAQSVNNSGKYSRFDAQLRAIQCDLNTYIEEVDDVSEFDEWKLGFDLEGKSDEIEGLMRENGSIDGVYKRVVPNVVDHDVFWFRYYYRVYRLKQAEDMRVKLVKRAISTEDEDELSWDVDEEDQEQVKNVDGLIPNESNIDRKNIENEGADSADKEVSKKDVPSEEKVATEGKTERSESGKESDISAVSTQPSVEEEDDMGWDEIEDIGSEDEKKVTTQSGSPNRAELKKRLSVSVDEDEDLSWDIEDDDEPMKR